MGNKKLTIERVMQSGESGLTLYQLSNGDIVNSTEIVQYVREGKLTGIVVGKDQNGHDYIKPTENGLK